MSASLRMLRGIGIVVGVMILLAALAVLALRWAVPRLAYRSLCSQLSEAEGITAVCAAPDGAVELTEPQLLASVVWLREYRSDNGGFRRISSEQRLALLDKGIKLCYSFNGGSVTLYVAEEGVYFDSGFGCFLIKAPDSSLYSDMKRALWAA